MTLEPTDLPLRSRDGTALLALHWATRTSPRGHALLIHGLGEHPARHAEICALLAERGVETVAAGLRGHGRSAGCRAFVAHWDEYFEDLEAAAGTLASVDLLLGHSMGGLLALGFLERLPGVRALSLSAPLIQAHFRPPRWKTALGRILSRIWPSCSMPSGLPPEQLCADPAVVAAYLSDPLVHDRVTPRWFTEMNRELLRIQTLPERCETPLRLELGAEDRLISNEAARAFAQRWSGPVEVIEWPRCRHEPHHEATAPEILRDRVDWLLARLEDPSPSPQRTGSSVTESVE